MRLESDGSTALIIVDSISKEFKAHLRERLAAFCFGAVQVAEDPDFYSFESTIRQFLERFETKAYSTQVGIAGELIVHALIPQTHPHLTSSAVFFNKEERNIKKGFDLTFLSNDGTTLWYGEVKSGEVNPQQSADEKAARLLQDAARDIAEKLGAGARRSRWDSAMYDTYATLEAGLARTARELLRQDTEPIPEDAHPAKNVVLASAVIHAPHHCEVTEPAVRASVKALSGSGPFSAMCVLVVQQSELESVIRYLREVADGE